jgi:hypothetical protein
VATTGTENDEVIGQDLRGRRYRLKRVQEAIVGKWRVKRWPGDEGVLIEICGSGNQYASIPDHGCFKAFTVRDGAVWASLYGCDGEVVCDLSADKNQLRIPIHLPQNPFITGPLFLELERVARY